MESRVALIGIIVENEDAVEKLNCVLHEYGRYIVGRMGIPYREKNKYYKYSGGRSSGYNKRNVR